MNFRDSRKIWNYKLIEYQKRRGSRIVVGYPYWLTIDPSSICNLQCVFCPTGQRRGTRTAAMLSLPLFTKIMNKLGPYLLHIDFCNWGEPLLNRDLPAMIALAKTYGPTVKVDSNMNVPLDEQAAGAFVRSGLDRLTMSVDGASQETYEVYRRGGNFATVLRNMELLVKAKKESGLPGPHLHWQFLVFRHNEHEIEKARVMSREIGVDSIGFTAPFCSPEWVSTKDEYNNYRVTGEAVTFKKPHERCTWLWDGITINADGSVSPCCSVEDEKDDFGNFFGKPFFLVWNNREYRTARAYVRDRLPAQRRNICTICDHIGASNHADVSPGK
jgi:MoaA/NifB/PqqE/SkfB family radical SAM enzyme